MKKSMMVIALLFGFTSIMAQPDEHESRKKKMESMRIAFISEAIDLQPEEAQQFWPVYNEMHGKLEALRMEVMKPMAKMRKDGNAIDDMSNAELEKLMKTQLENEMEAAKIKSEYHGQFLELLGTKKTAKLYKAEMEFKRELLHRFQRGGGKDGHRGGPPHERQ